MTDRLVKSDPDGQTRRRTTGRHQAHFFAIAATASLQRELDTR